MKIQGSLSEAQDQFETQNFGAASGVDGVPGSPSLALQFSGGLALAAFHRRGKLAGKIEIAADAFGILTAESEDRFGVQQIYRVFELILAGSRRVIEKMKPYLQ